MNLYRKTGTREGWNRFVSSLPKAERSLVERDAGVSLAIRSEDYVWAEELAAQVAYGDRSDSRRARENREADLWLERIFNGHLASSDSERV
jgi:hypothetical protein